MPPKKQITNEQIVEKAFELVKKNGVSVLSARNLAAELNCSTQPIYQSFADMNQLKSVLAGKAVNYMQQFIANSYDDERPRILSKILGYIKFASEETNLFQLIFASGVNDAAEQNNLVKLENELEFNMIVYAHGIIMMKAFGTLNLEWQQIQIIVTKAYEDFSKDKYR